MTRQTGAARLDLKGVPEPQDTRTRLVLVDKLRQHKTDGAWLPAGVWPAVDELRGQHHRRIGAASAAADKSRAREAEWAREDASQEEALKVALRAGEDPPADRRDREGREAERTRLAENLAAAIHVLGEFAEHAVAVLRQNEAAWLADLRARREPAQEKIREAEEAVRRATAEQHRLGRLGQWLQAAADDEGFGAVAPGNEDPPPNFQMPPGALERPWHKAKFWNPGTGAAPEPVGVPSTRGVNTVVLSDRDRGGRRAR